MMQCPIGLCKEPVVQVLYESKCHYAVLARICLSVAGVVLAWIVLGRNLIDGGNNVPLLKAYLICVSEYESGLSKLCHDVQQHNSFPRPAWRAKNTFIVRQSSYIKPYIRRGIRGCRLNTVGYWTCRMDNIFVMPFIPVCLLPLRISKYGKNARALSVISVSDTSNSVYIAWVWAIVRMLCVYFRTQPPKYCDPCARGFPRLGGL